MNIKAITITSFFLLASNSAISENLPSAHSFDFEGVWNPTVDICIPRDSNNEYSNWSYRFGIFSDGGYSMVELEEIYGNKNCSGEIIRFNEVSLIYFDIGEKLGENLWEFNITDENRKVIKYSSMKYKNNKTNLTFNAVIDNLENCGDKKENRCKKFFKERQIERN